MTHQRPSNFRAFLVILSDGAPRVRRMGWPAWCTLSSYAGWCSRSDAVPDSGLYNSRHTYTALEAELRNNARNRVYKKIHFPKELERVLALEADLEFYFGEDWRTEDEVLAPPSACTKEYGRLRHDSSHDPAHDSPHDSSHDPPHDSSHPGVRRPRP